MNTEILLSLITSGVSILGVFGGGALLYYKQEKKAKELANEITAISEWKELYATLEEKCNKLDNKCDKLYDDIDKHRNEKISLRNKITELEVENAKLSYTHCDVKKCPNRIPPTGY